MGTEETNNNQSNNFDLLNKLFDDNPDLDEQQILELFNTKANKQDTIDVKLISESIVNESDALIDSAFNNEKPDDHQSSAKYEIGELFKSGGQSDVYFAQRIDGAYHKIVILKVLKQKFSSEDEKAGFLKEVQILANLLHPNIVNIIDAGFNQKNEPWMVLAYIEGLQIDEFVLENNLINFDIVKTVLKIVQAMSYVHKQNIYHLDIKPENIIVKKHNNTIQPMLIDFGISYDHSQQAKNNVDRYATPAFASPEQLGTIEHPIDHLSDIYSVGKLFGVLLQKPDADIESIIIRCTQQQPIDRYQSMQLLADDLCRYTDQEPVSTRPLKLQQRWVKKFNKKPILNSILSLMLITIMGLASYSFIQKAQQIQQSIAQTKASQYYWDIADEIKNSTRLLYLKPVNNIQPEIETLRIKYQQMIVRYKTESDQQKQFLAAVVAQTAIGFGDYQVAQDILTFANDLIANDKAVELLLASNYLNLYKQEVQVANQYSENKIRQYKTQQLNEKYLVPAQNLFKNKPIDESQNGNSYQSMLLYLQGDTSGALKLLDESDKNEIWPIPRMLLASHILFVEAKKHTTQGENELARQWVKSAYSIIDEASQIARTHPQVLTSKCQIQAELYIFEIDINTEQTSLTLNGCDDLIKALPTASTSIFTASNAYISLAKIQLHQGHNPYNNILIAESLLNNISNITTQPQANLMLGQTNLIKGRWKRDSNQDGIAELKTAIDYHKTAADLKPQDYLIQTEYAFSLFNLGTSIRPFNQLADESYQQSTQILLGLIGHADASILLSMNIVRILTDHGYYRYQNSLSADQQLSHASEVAQTMYRKWPDNIKVQHSKMYVEWTYADYLVFQNKNPEPHLPQAIQAFKHIIQDQPKRWVLQYNQISAMLSGVTYFLEHGQSQTQQLETISKNLDNIKQFVSQDVNLSSHYGYFYNMQALDQIINSKNPDRYFAASRSFNKACLTSPIDEFGCLTQIATLFKLEHSWSFDNGQFNKNRWKEDLSILDAGLIKYPNHHQLLALRAQLMVLETKFLKLDKQQIIKILTKAHVNFETVLTKQPLLKNRYQHELENLQNQLKSYE